MKKNKKKKSGKAAPAAPVTRTFNKHNIILLLTVAVGVMGRFGL